MRGSGRAGPERVVDSRVSAQFFRTLGAPAARGRTLLREEDEPGKDQMVVLSDGSWRRRFGASA